MTKLEVILVIIGFGVVGFIIFGIIEFLCENLEKLPRLHRLYLRARENIKEIMQGHQYIERRYMRKRRRR